MIVSTKEDGQRFSAAKGATCNILVSGERIMLMYVELEPNSEIPLHSHTHEQAGICLKGKVELQGEDKTVVISPNSVYCFHSNEKHRAKAVGKAKAVLLETFSLPREDYRAKFKSENH